MPIKLSRGEILGRLEESSRDNCIDWRGSPIRAGDNVVFRLSDKKPLQAGQIIDIQDFRDIRKAERSAISTKPRNGRDRMVLIRHRCIVGGKDAPPPDLVRYCQLPDSLREVADTVDLEWIPSIAVTSPCFIFHADTIQRGLFTCKGMDRFYFIRYRKTRNGKFIPVSEKEWNPFYRCSLYPEIESFPESLWNNILTLKHEVQRAMSRGGQWDGRTVSAKIIGAQSSFFSYLKDELQSIIGNASFVESSRFSRMKKTVYDNLSVNRIRVKGDVQLIRLLYEDEMAAVRKVFGSTFAVGITTPVPSQKMLRENPFMKRTVPLRNSDVVRVVTCLNSPNDKKCKPTFAPSSLETSTRPMKHQCSYRGIDFRYHNVKHGLPELTVQCRFVKVEASSFVLKELFCGNNSDGDHSDSSSSGVIVSKGDYLTLDGPRVYVVTDVHGDGTVRCVSPFNAINDPIDITMEEAIAGVLRQCS